MTQAAIVAMAEQRLHGDAFPRFGCTPLSGTAKMAPPDLLGEREIVDGVRPAGDWVALAGHVGYERLSLATERPGPIGCQTRRLCASCDGHSGRKVPLQGRAERQLQSTAFENDL